MTIKREKPLGYNQTTGIRIYFGSIIFKAYHISFFKPPTNKLHETKMLSLQYIY